MQSLRGLAKEYVSLYPGEVLTDLMDPKLVTVNGDADDAADAVVARAKITKTEFLLGQTLIKCPSSGKYCDRLTEFTADIAALCKKP